MAKLFSPKDREAVRAQKAAWRAANLEHCRATDRAWYAANRERLVAKAAARIAANPEPARASGLSYRKTHRSQANARAKAYRAANPERIRSRNEEWSRRGRCLISDSYCRSLLKVGGLGQIPPELIELTRNLIRAKRLVRAAKKSNP